MGSAFTAGDYKWPPNSEERKALIAKINKQISHLTDQRTLTAQEKIGERDRTALYVCFSLQISRTLLSTKSRQHRMEASSRALVLPRRGFFSCAATVQKKSPGLGHGRDSGVV